MTYTPIIMKTFIIMSFADQSLDIPPHSILNCLARKAQDKYNTKSEQLDCKMRKIVKKCSAEYVICEYLAILDEEMTYI